MIWTLIAGTAVLLGFLWWWLNQSPAYRGLSVNDLLPFFAEFGETATVGSLMFIEHQGSAKFLQFVKRESGSAEPRLGFGFPDAPWSRDHFEPVAAALRQRGFACAIEVTDENEEHVTRFLQIEDIAGPDAAQRLASTALHALGIDKGTFRVRFKATVDIATAKRQRRRLTG